MFRGTVWWVFRGTAWWVFRGTAWWVFRGTAWWVFRGTVCGLMSNSSPDLGVRPALGGEPCDLLFLGGELVARLGRPRPDVFARGEQLDLRPVDNECPVIECESVDTPPPLSSRTLAGESIPRLPCARAA